MEAPAIYNEAQVMTMPKVSASAAAAWPGLTVGENRVA